MSNSKQEKIRVQIDFTLETLNELDVLREKLHASYRTEVIRNAIGVLKWVTNNILDGNKIIVHKSNGEIAEVNFPFLFAK